MTKEDKKQLEEAKAAKLDKETQHQFEQIYKMQKELKYVNMNVKRHEDIDKIKERKKQFKQELF